MKKQKEVRTGVKHQTKPFERRDMLKWLLGAGVGSMTNIVPRRLSAQSMGDQDDPRFLIVIACAGGASIIDGPLAVRESESGVDTLNSFPDQDVYRSAASPFSATRVIVDGLGSIPYQGVFDQRSFVEQHADDMAVLTYTGTSVNHLIAQKRSLTGNDAWGGRTIQEAVAAQYGEGYVLPNVNMSSGGYIEPGHDPSLPSYAKAELISSPQLWPLSLHSTQGVVDGLKPADEVIQKARQWRNDRLEGESVFMRTFEEDPTLQRWLTSRNEALPEFERLGLIDKLFFIPESPLTPLSAYGLSSTEDQELLADAFPNLLTDPLEAQAALAYLLITQDVSVTVTIGPDFSPVVLPEADQLVSSPPLAFDYSHQDHRSAQALMWNRLYKVASTLIQLLSGKEWRGGSSYWDQSMIYFASEFGRTRKRPSGAFQFSTGHDLNNGSLVISPLVRGGKVYGGVDPTSTLTYGYDTQTGEPEPQREMTEPEHFSALAHALNLDLQGSGLPTVTALRKSI